jgi:DNA-binding LacI/PurR family transcriptional regulator
VSRAAEYSAYRAVLYNLDLLYENDDYNTPRERVRRKMEEILRHVDSGIIGAVYISQYPRDVTGVIPVVPFPVIYAYCYTNDGAPSVNTDDQQGAYIAVQELISLRKKRIAMISGPINSIPMTKRLSGYQRALIDAGLPVDLRMVVTGDWDIERSCERMTKLLQLDPPPDGVFCQSDHIALGVCKAIRQAGKSIPGDIAVVGFDNYDFASFVSPSLTTIDQPLEKIGRVAFSRLKKIVDREEIEERSVLLDARLIRREST